ncbi:hypothetical protein [Amycolatopsis sp. NPDC054798]
MDAFGFRSGDLVRHRTTGALGRVHLWDFDPRDPGASEGEVRWDGFTADDLEDVRHDVDIVARDGAAAADLKVVCGCVISRATAEGGHEIAQSVTVYLLWGPEGWYVDPRNLDGYPLDEDGPVTNGDCECGDPDACEAAVQEVREAAEIRLPTGSQLAKLLADAVQRT